MILFPFIIFSNPWNSLGFVGDEFDEVICEVQGCGLGYFGAFAEIWLEQCFNQLFHCFGMGGG